MSHWHSCCQNNPASGVQPVTQLEVILAHGHGKWSRPQLQEQILHTGCTQLPSIYSLVMKHYNPLSTEPDSAVINGAGGEGGQGL